MRACIVCGERNGACGHQPLRFPPITSPTERGNRSVTDNETIYLPKQKVRRGVAGYKGKNIKVVADPSGARAADAAKAKAKAAKDDE